MNGPKVSIKDYMNTVYETFQIETSWRMGQTYFNVLTDAWPEMAEYVRGTSIDPFHKDSLVPAFLSYVLGEWK